MSDDEPHAGRSAGGIGDRIRWIIEDRLRTSHAEFSRRLAVKPPQLSRWINRADYPPGEAYLARIAELGGVPVSWLRYGVGAPVSAEENGAPEEVAAGDELAAQDLFRHFEGMVRRMGGADVAPEELRFRKLDVIDGLTRLYAAQGVVPGWVYDLKGRILRDEL
ncbi:MAG: helix-turn-helix domain-containing protein [Gemmatimonadetes bacterium]|nr:helix-turn-helix domain-containing protein [Gemmatimonadota bacterium]